MADKLFDLCLAVGGVLTGLAPSLLDKTHRILGLVVLLIGIVLFGGPFWLKHYQKAD